MKKPKKSAGVQNESNVIDLTKRIQARAETEAEIAIATGQKPRVTWDIERTKVAVATSLLSVVLLVTLANNNVLSGGGAETNTVETEFASVTTETIRPSRGIASVSGTGMALAEQDVVKRLASHELTAEGVGRPPSSVEAFVFGTLEGKYAVKLADGKVHGIEYSAQDDVDTPPTSVSNLSAFLVENRGIMPVQFDRAIRVGREKSGQIVRESFELIDDSLAAKANVEFELDSSGGLLAMKIESR
jgi:hypothetical protein